MLLLQLINNEKQKTIIPFKEKHNYEKRQIYFIKYNRVKWRFVHC